jgi:hypothetical protein
VKSTAGSSRLAVLLIGLPGFYESLLQRECAPDPRITVARLSEEGGTDAVPRDVDAVIVVGIDAPSLRRAAELVGRSARVLGAVAITDDEPRGDVYLVTPAGTNVTPHELAQVIRDIAAGPVTGMSNAADSIPRGLTESER